MNDIEHRVLGAVDEGRLTRLLQDMVRHRSYSNTPGEGDLARWLGDYVRSHDLEVSHQNVTAERLNTVVSLPGSGCGTSLMLNGHIDTNMVGIGWTRDPWGGAIEDGCLYGIGVSNMKAADAAMIEAAIALRESGVLLRGHLTIALVVGELQGGVGTVHLIEQGIHADRFIVGEPTDLALLTLHAGSFEAEIRVFGQTRHLSKMEEGVNAIESGCTILEALKGVGFSGVDRADYRGLQRLNVGAIRGGMGTEFLEWRLPSVPDYCVIKVAGRIAPGQTPESAIVDLRGMLERLSAHDPNIRAEVHLIESTQKMYMPPFEIATDDPFVLGVALAYEDITSTKPRIGDVAPYKFYGTDAAHLSSRGGMTGLVCGPGGKYNTMPDERVEIADVVTAAKLYALVALRTCR